MSEFLVGKFDRGKAPKWLCRFMPVRSCLALADVEPAELAASGKRLVLLDVDNTLLPWRSEDIPQPTLDWVTACKAAGMELCVLSNTRHPERLKRICARLEVPFILGKFKPNPAIYREALAKFGRKPGEAVMIGDQIFTDIFGGNRAGIEGIWVKPLTSRDFVGTKFYRLCERLLRPTLRKAMQSNPESAATTQAIGIHQRPIVRQFVKFAIVGGSSMIIDNGLHYLLMFQAHSGDLLLSDTLGQWLRESLPKLFSFAKDDGAAAFPVFKVMSAGLAVLNGFYWNRRWTFSIDSPEDRVRHFHRYATVALLGMLWNTLITTSLNNVIPGHRKISWAVASAVATVIVAFWNFSGTKFWAFRDKKA